MAQTAYIGVGSNLGDRRDHYRRAVAEIQELPDTKVVARSSLYESEPHGRARNWFLNGVIAISTELEAKDLLKRLQKIEKDLGRKRNASKNSVSRIIDLDILLFGNQIIQTRNLKVPHPEIPNRRFVLIPLSELAPALSHPKLGETMSTLAVSTEDRTKVMLFHG